MKQSEDITIHASPERVWRALTDLEDRVRRNDRWDEMLKRLVGMHGVSPCFVKWGS